MRPEPEFRLDEMKALIPWREWHLTLRQIVAGAAGLAALIILASSVDMAEDRLAYLIAAGVALVLFPTLALLHNHFNLRAPLAMDSGGIFAPTLWGQKYIPWSNVHTIAHVHSMVGWSRAPIEFNLVVFLRQGVPRRVALPELSGDEREQLFEVLGRISRLHRISFVADHTEGGRRTLKRLPWLWI